MGAMDPEILPAGTENELSITFTVSGFNYDNVEQAAAKAEAESAQAEAEAAQTETASRCCAGSAAMFPIAAVLIAAALLIFKNKG